MQGLDVRAGYCPVDITLKYIFGREIREGHASCSQGSCRLDDRGMANDV